MLYVDMSWSSISSWWTNQNIKFKFNLNIIFFTQINFIPLHQKILLQFSCNLTIEKPLQITRSIVLPNRSRMAIEFNFFKRFLALIYLKKHTKSSICKVPSLEIVSCTCIYVCMGIISMYVTPLIRLSLLFAQRIPNIYTANWHASSHKNTPQ